MFKSPFSFEGRIRRTEYGLSLIIYTVVIFIIAFASAMVDRSDRSEVTGLIFLILILPVLYFVWAQGAKRCHDLGNSGWFQLIPFYGLWLLFADSKPGINQYGPNPKGIGNDTEFSFENHKTEY